MHAILPDSLQKRLLAAGVQDEASLRAVLESDPDLRAAYEHWLISATLQKFAATADEDALRALVRQTPILLEAPLIDAIERAIVVAQERGDTANANALAQRLVVLREIKAELRRRGIGMPVVADIHFTPNAAMVAATGWDGDRLYVFSNGDADQIAFVWLTTWDSETDAREFYDAWKSWIHTGYPDDKLSGFVPSLYTHWTSTNGDVWLEIRGKDVLIVDGFPPAMLARAVTSSWGAKKQMLTPAMIRVRKKAKGSTRQ